MPDYLPADGWVLKYYAAGYGLTAWNVTATTSGTGYLVTLTSAQTAALQIGTFDFAAYAEQTISGTPQKWQVWSGRLQITPSIVSPSSYDSRSYARKVLTQLETALLAFHAGTVQSATIEGMTYTVKNVAELEAAREKYQATVNGEVADARIASGLSAGRIVLARMRRPGL